MTLTSARLRFLLALVLGLAAGLVYGWLLQPVEFVDTSPDSLRSDFKTDYVLMVAQVFAADSDPESARRRLATLGPEPPAQFVAEALDFARTQGFDGSDLEQLQQLHSSLERRQASPEISNP